MKSVTSLMFGLTMMSSFGTTVIVTNNQGPTATDEVVNAAGTLVSGFGAVGTLDELGITGATTTWAALNFQTWGLASGAVTTSTSGQFNYSGAVNPTASVFSGDNIYLAIGFGGVSLATSTELFIYKFNATFGIADSGTPISLTLGNGDIGTTLLGTEVGTPESSAGRFRSTAITAVPEPSAALLGALGALGLLRRRRN